MGIIVDENLAKRTGCRCYEYNGKFLCWSSGIVGTLSDAQEYVYCNPREVIGGLPPKLEARYRTFKAASESCEGLPISERLKCMAREFEKLAGQFERGEVE